MLTVHIHIETQCNLWAQYTEEGGKKLEFYAQLHRAPLQLPAGLWRRKVLPFSHRAWWCWFCKVFVKIGRDKNEFGTERGRDFFPTVFCSRYIPPKSGENHDVKHRKETSKAGRLSTRGKKKGHCTCFQGLEKMKKEGWHPSVFH